MAKRKALSAEDKRIKLLEIFHETCNVFQLKELERIAPKEKGIVMQSVKGTLQELVDNDQVRTEKIAGSIYFWSFPSENLNTIKRQLSESEKLNTQLQAKIENAQKQLESAETALEDADSIAVLERQIAVMKKDKDELHQRVAAVAKEVDYDDVAAKERDAKKILEAANRWTDNIFSIKSWCKRKFGKEDQELDKAFGIPEDLDYIDA